MSGKLLIICACIAFASANYLTDEAANLVNVFETEDAIYVRVSDEEVEHLRLPRNADKPKLEPPTTGHEPGSKITFIPMEEVVQEPPFLNPSSNHNSGSRWRRQLWAQGGGGSGGFDFNAGGRAKLWESGNNALHGSASYGQRSGSSDFGGGLMFSRSF